MIASISSWRLPSTGGPLDDALVLIRGAAFHEAPERDCLLQKLPTISRLIDDFSLLIQGIVSGCGSDCVQRHGASFAAVTPLASKSLHSASMSLAETPRDSSKPLPA